MRRDPSRGTACPARDPSDASGPAVVPQHLWLSVYSVIPLLSPILPLVPGLRAPSVASSPRMRSCRSVADSLLAVRSRAYRRGGISPVLSVLAESVASCCRRSHSEKFTTRRPRSTSRWMSQEIGATRENHGQAVALLWQSKQTRTARLRVRSLSQGG